MNEHEQQVLQTEQSLYDHVLLVRLRHFCQGYADGCCQHQYGQHVAFCEWLDDIVGYYAQDMIVVRCLSQVLRHVSHAALHQGCGKVAWGYDVVKHQADSSCCYCGEHGVGEGVSEYLACISLIAKRCQGGGHCQGDGWYSQELEQAGVDSGDEVHQSIEPPDAEHA